MTQAAAPTERAPNSQDTRAIFLQMLRKVCYLAPEQEDMIIRRMHDNDDFFMATGQDATPFLELIIQRHQERHASLNLCTHGFMRSGKSHGSLIIGYISDPTFTVDHVVFDLAELQLLLPHTVPGSVYVVDDVRERYGLGSKTETVNTQTFLESCAASGTCIVINSPSIKLTVGIKYFLEFFGYCPEYSLAMLYSNSLVMRQNDLTEVRIPIGFIQFIYPDGFQAFLNAYEAKKKLYVAEVTKKSGGSGTNIVHDKIKYLMSEVDFSECTDLQDIKDELVMWDHTQPSALIAAMARRIHKLLKKEHLSGPTAPKSYDDGTFRFVVIKQEENPNLIPAMQAIYEELAKIGQLPPVKRFKPPHLQVFTAYYGSSESLSILANQYNVTEQALRNTYSGGGWIAIAAEEMGGYLIEHAIQRLYFPDFQHLGGPTEPDLYHPSTGAMVEVKLRTRRDRAVPEFAMLCQREQATPEKTVLATVLCERPGGTPRVTVTFYSVQRTESGKKESAPDHLPTHPPAAAAAGAPAPPEPPRRRVGKRAKKATM